MDEKVKIVHVFWTGGLDSTFRVMQLLLTTDHYVQPHYIVRHENSTGIEIDTMIKMRREIIRIFPKVRPRFLQTIYTNEGLIKFDDDINESVNNLKKEGKVAEQYQVMANYCKEFNIRVIDVALTRISGEKEFFEKFKNAEAFKSFQYPVINLSKKEMVNIAKDNKWEQILFMTSFCRRPNVKIKPCGVCGPCADAVSAGMGFRFPLFSYIKAICLIPFRSYYRKNYFKHDKSKLFKWITKKFEHKF
ncbi:MAG: hypothetical protein JW717_12945 [Marinilabiliaceae bacterium]|nr:hypothetical protein [Marinilabiliaceae bacterium]